MNTVPCPECGTPCTIEWSGLDLVENSGDETLATKNYIPAERPAEAPASSGHTYDFDKNVIENAKLYAYVFENGTESFNQDRYDAFLAGAKCKVVAFESMQEVLSDLSKELQEARMTAEIESANVQIFMNKQKETFRELQEARALLKESLMEIKTGYGLAGLTGPKADPKGLVKRITDNLKDR